MFQIIGACCDATRVHTLCTLPLCKLPVHPAGRPDLCVRLECYPVSRRLLGLEYTVGLLLCGSLSSARQALSCDSIRRAPYYTSNVRIRTTYQESRRLRTAPIARRLVLARHDLDHNTTDRRRFIKGHQLARLTPVAHSHRHLDGAVSCFSLTCSTLLSFRHALVTASRRSTASFTRTFNTTTRHRSLGSRCSALRSRCSQPWQLLSPRPLLSVRAATCLSSSRSTRSPWPAWTRLSCLARLVGTTTLSWGPATFVVSVIGPGAFLLLLSHNRLDLGSR